MYPESGYKAITPVQFLNVFGLLREGRLRQQAFRVYMACFVVVAIREAAERARKRHRGRGGKLVPRYRITELSALCGLTESQIRRQLKELAREDLVAFSEGEIRLRRGPIDGIDDLLSAVRAPARPIPVPRECLRFMAREKRNSVSKVMVAYMIRGLTIGREQGEIGSRGSAKLSWISNLAGISERCAHYARAELLRIGWLAPDTGSKQRKLNRHGAYFEILLSWRREGFAPRTAKTAAPFAPPKEDMKTLNRDQNQKTGSGFSKDGGGGKLPAPNLFEIRVEDFHRLDRLEVLYQKAVQSKLLKPGEASVLNFIGAAVRAREAKEEPARIFAAIVRRGLWHHITCAQEDVARRALMRIREIDPDRFREKSEARKCPHRGLAA